MGQMTYNKLSGWVKVDGVRIEGDIELEMSSD